MLQESEKHQFKFSVVIPVYNVKDYIAETIDSILSQTMVFEKDCEIILVDDGSTDSSASVCKSYVSRYPANIRYVKQENAGPGAARNRGISEAQGKYVSLLDSDDKISPDTLQEVYDFFERHHEEIDIVGIKWEFFEARTGGHPLNYKFTDDRIVNLEDEPEAILGSAAPSFFKKTILDKHSFDPSVGRYSEDGRFMGELLLERKKYGIVTKPTYFYRKRSSQTSSQDGNRNDKFWYLETPRRAWLDLINYSKLHCDGNVPKFIQYMVMYDLQWRYKQSTQSALTDEELDQYKESLLELLREIDDDVVLAQRSLDKEYILHVLSLKHGENIYEHAKAADMNIWDYRYKNNSIFNPESKRPIVKLQLVEINENIVTLEGTCSGFIFDDCTLRFKVGEEWCDVIDNEQPHLMVKSLDQNIFDRNVFKVEFPAKTGVSIRPFLVKKSGESISLRFSPRLTSRFSETGFSYRVFSSCIIKWTNNHMYIDSRSKATYIKAEVKRLSSLIKEGDLRAIFYRCLYHTVRPFYKKPIWLLSDRMGAADDNGEFLFRYLSKLNSINIIPYFALSKKSSEFKGVKKYGKVLNFFSIKHKLMFLLSDKVVSSEATGYTLNVFGKNAQGVVDLYTYDFVFLQHGIIRDDISGWLNRYAKNIKLFITSAKPEYDSVINGDYGYGDDVVKLTGLARYDFLDSKPQGKIILAPTWRENLAGILDQATGIRSYNEQFKYSDYFKFYNDLINDQDLINILRGRRMTGELYLHPSFVAQLKDFEGNDVFKVMSFPYSYPTAKKEGNLLVTDYSSVAFDFAYLKKPVLYTQFDVDTFYNLHTSSEGYLSYENDGLGDVVYAYENAVSKIIDIIGNNCTMEDKYVTRTENFFAHTDKKNCERIYTQILNMDTN